MELRLQIKPYAFKLSRPLHTAAGVLQHRRGWLLRLEDSAGRLGWGEVSPLGGWNSDEALPVRLGSDDGAWGGLDCQQP